MIHQPITYDSSLAFDPVLNNNTPEQIQRAARLGLAKSLWKVGDRVGITFADKNFHGVTLNATYYAVIIGFDHNSSTEGNNSIHFQVSQDEAGNNIAFVKNYNSTDGFAMKSEDKNNGGWQNTNMRNTLCAQFFHALPRKWQNVISPCIKWTDNKGGGTNTAGNVDYTVDAIWLLSEFEVFGARTLANSEEKNHQQQYEYYASGKSTIMHYHTTPTDTCGWWLRSPDATNATSYCNVRADKGNATSHTASASRGIVPCFKIS